jgi:excisionase family DNA binding protein
VARPDPAASHADAPLLLTREQAAELCQVSLEIIDQWSREPGFPIIRRNGGHFVRIHRAALERWLEAFATRSNPPYMDEPPTPPSARGSRIRRLSAPPRKSS